MTLAGTKMGSGVFDSVTKDGVTTFGTGVDPTVGSLGYTYDDAGLLASATSYGTGVGAGPAPVLNQDAETYDGFGQLATEEQAVAGTASPASPTVGYTYDAANGDRMTGIVYPDGRTLAYSYAGSSLSTAASQLTSIGDASGTIQSYSYLGLDTPVTFADKDVKGDIPNCTLAAPPVGFRSTGTRERGRSPTSVPGVWTGRSAGVVPAGERRRSPLPRRATRHTGLTVC